MTQKGTGAVCAALQTRENKSHPGNCHDADLDERALSGNQNEDTGN